MFKALVKSRWQATLSLLLRSGRKGKRRSGGALVGYGLLLIYVAFCVLFLFFMMASTLCQPLLDAGLGWLYFALMGVMGLALGVIGSVFTAQTQLYEAKDNEMLLAMPIPPSYILGSRMLALYGQSFLCSAVVLLPTLAAYLQCAGFSTVAGIGFGLTFLLLPLLSLTLSCILGWLVALIASRMRNKSLITVLLSLVFLGAYFYLYSRMNTYLQLLIVNGEAVGETVRRVLFPLYQMGLACMGSGMSLGLFALCVVVPFAIVYWVLSHSFVKIATTRRGAAKIRYRERTLKVSSQDRALLSREARHLWASPMYLLNGAFGSVFLIIGAVAAAIKGRELMEFMTLLPGVSDRMPLIACACVCFVVSMNIVTAPSVSLEGKTLWLIQSLPVGPWQVLRAKARLHMAVTAIPALVCSAVLTVLLRPGVWMAILLLVTPVVCAYLFALLGLAFNLRMPRLDWVSEAQAVKRSGSAFVSIFATWGILLAFLGLYFLAKKVMTDDWYVLACTVVMALCSWLLLRWLKGRGAEIFATLS